MDAMQTQRLLMITGLPGTGKTTVATALAERIAARHFNTDMIREDMELRGQYDRETKERVYLELLARAREGLRTAGKVVVDGTFYQAQLRNRFKDLAHVQGASIHWIELWADPKLIQTRVSRKRRYSEADFEVYLKIKGLYEPIRVPHLRLESNNSNLEEIVEEILSYLDSGSK